jgi:hypothetical protein
MDPYVEFANAIKGMIFGLSLVLLRINDHLIQKILKDSEKSGARGSISCELHGRNTRISLGG